MTRLLTATATAVSLLGLAAAPALAEGKTHHIAIQVDQNDPHTMNLALNNAENVESYYKSKGDSVEIELVAYGPGLNMLVDGKSPVAARIAQMALAMDHMTFSACNNTLTKMEKKAGHPIKLLSEARIVPAGVVRLSELQEDGWSYVRP